MGRRREVWPQHSGSPGADFSAYLAPGEIVRWSGRPQQGLTFRQGDIFLVPFSLVWCGFAIFWEYLAWTAGGDGFFMLFGAVFVCVGLYMVFGRFLFDAFMRSRMRYALTDTRALILGGFSGNSLTEFDLRSTSSIRYAAISGGRGTINFEPESTVINQAFRWHSPHELPEFFKTGNANVAYRHIQAIRAARTSF